MAGRVNGNVGLPRKTSTTKKTEKTELCNCLPLQVFNKEYCFFVTVLTKDCEEWLFCVAEISPPKWILPHAACGNKTVL